MVRHFTAIPPCGGNKSEFFDGFLAGFLAGLALGIGTKKK